MKKFTIISVIGILMLAACGSESSPEGRSKTRDEKLQMEIDSLKSKDKALGDRINLINDKLRGLRINNY